jgi:hypothetical protein
MSERHGSPYDSTAHKWLALIERRQRNFIELWETGRWQHYYTHAEFLDQMRKVLDLRNRWAVLAGVPMSEQITIRQYVTHAASKQTGRLDGEIGSPHPLQAAGKAGRQRTSAGLLAAVSAPL